MFKMLGRMVIFMILVFGAVDCLMTEDYCPGNTRQICSCSSTETGKLVLVPLNIYSTCWIKGNCVPCPKNLLDYVNCLNCPGNICPVCPENKFSLQSLDESNGMDIESYGRKSRDTDNLFASDPQDSWCTIEKDLNGEINCSIKTYRKDCSLKCLPGSTSDGQTERTFECNRKEKVWTPAFKPCEYADTADNLDVQGPGEEAANFSKDQEE